MTASIHLEATPVPAAPPASGRSADALVGREALFADLRFRSLGRPVPGRVLVRLELT